jgi:hypothetical protein
MEYGSLVTDRAEWLAERGEGRRIRRMGVNHTMDIGSCLVDARMYEDLGMAFKIAPDFVAVQVADDKMIGSDLLEAKAMGLHQDSIFPWDPNGDMS